LSCGSGIAAAYDYDDLEMVKNIFYNNYSSPAYIYTYKGEGTLGQLMRDRGQCGTGDRSLSHIGVGVSFEVHGQYGESRVVSFN